jgi:hypothetical protein
MHLLIEPQIKEHATRKTAIGVIATVVGIILAIIGI